MLGDSIGLHCEACCVLCPCAGSHTVRPWYKQISVRLQGSLFDKEERYCMKCLFDNFDTFLLLLHLVHVCINTQMHGDILQHKHRKEKIHKTTLSIFIAAKQNMLWWDNTQRVEVMNDTLKFGDWSGHGSYLMSYWCWYKIHYKSFSRMYDGISINSWLCIMAS